MRDDFSSGVKDTLAKRVGYRCSNPKCRALTSGPQKNPEKAINVGVASHITAASAGGPRYNNTLTPEQRESSENGIWLCQKCGKLIDNDVTRYTVEILGEWKKQAEQNALHDVESGRKYTNSSKITGSKKKRDTSGISENPLKNYKEAVEIISHEATLFSNEGILKIEGIIKNKSDEHLDVFLSTDVYDFNEKIKIGRGNCSLNLDPHGQSKFDINIVGLKNYPKPKFKFNIEKVFSK
jgi:hypothetical protein